MKRIIAILVGKILHFIGKPLGKSTNLPGEIALKICPNLISTFKIRGKVLAVTGSNGKTTTANMVAHILKSCGYSVANNAKGSNLTGGVATTLITSSNISGYIDRDFVVLEVDERFSRLIFRNFAPDIMLVTNLFRDQLTRNGNVDVIISKLTEAIKPNTKLVLNANDPISSLLAPDNDRVYYEMVKTTQSTEKSINITHDCKVCPICFAPMNYEFFHYNHIGKFSCSKCDYQTQKADYTAESVDFKTGSFLINGVPALTGYKSAFNFLNVTAAVALCCEAGVDIASAVKAVNTFKVSRQRFDEFDIGGRKAVMILSKNQNPVSFDQSISYVVDADEEEKTVIVFVNNINHTHNKDTTWLYDISFGRLDENIDSIICTGPRAYDLAVRLKLDGFNMKKVLTEPNLENLKSVVSQTKGTVYVLTELYDAKAIIEAISSK